MSAWFTLSRSAQPLEHRVRGSRFIARAVPAANREAVDAVLQKVRQAYPDATHVCYAYRLATAGTAPEEFSTDAGEPGGSAGIPILNAIRQRELMDVLVWVVRYFGGAKLGIPGLIEAYGGVARLSMENAQIVPWIAMVELQLVLPYTLVDRVKGEVRKRGGQLLQEEYTTDAAIRCLIPRGEEQAFRERLEEWGGRAVSIAIED